MISRSIAVVLGCSLLAGCARFERIKQCRALAATVNPELAAIEQLLKGKRSPSQLEAISKKYAQLSERLASVRFVEAALTNPMQEYRNVLSDTATFTRSLAEAVRVGDETRILRDRAELERLTRRERLHLTLIETHCRG